MNFKVGDKVIVHDDIIDIPNTFGVIVETKNNGYTVSGNFFNRGQEEHFFYFEEVRKLSKLEQVLK